jgi:hypothetical protein
MALRQRQPRLLGLASVLLLSLLVQSDFGFPARQTRANPGPGVFSCNVGSLVSVVLAGSNRVVGGLETLYELHELADRVPQPARSSGVVCLNSGSKSSPQETLCEYRAMPAPSGTAYRCPTPGRSGKPSLPIHHC